MAKLTYSSSNMSGQQFGFLDDGEVALTNDDSGGGTYLIRKGNDIYKTSLEDLGNQVLLSQGKNPAFIGAAGRQDAGRQALASRGIDLSNAKQLSVYDQGLIENNKIPGFKIKPFVGSGDINQRLDLLSSTSSGNNEQITVGIDPNNTSGLMSSSNLTGDIFRPTATKDIAAEVAKTNAVPTPQGSAGYTVKSGDTLSQIAANNGISLQQLLQMNPQFQANPNLIYPGQMVNLGGGQSSGASGMSAGGASTSGGFSTSTGTTTPPMGSSGGSYPGGSTTGAPTGNSDLWYGLASRDPFAKDLLDDPQMRAAFDSWPDELKQVWLQSASSLGKSIESGKVVNPNIDITPAQLKQFYDQVASEIDPEYAQYFSQIKGDIDLSLNRMTEDYTRSIQRAEDPFRQNLAAQAENEAQSGTTFSSGRQEREQRAVTDQSNKLDDAFRQTSRSAQDILRGYEGTVGTDKARSLNLPSVSQYSANTGGFAASSPRSLDPGLIGGVSYGTLGQEQEFKKRQQANEYESLYRQGRVLDYSPL